MRAVFYGFTAAGLLAVAAPASALTIQSTPPTASASTYIANEREAGRRLNLGEFAGESGAQPLPRHMAEAQVQSDDDGSRYAADPVAFMARTEANGAAACRSPGVTGRAGAASPAATAPSCR